MNEVEIMKKALKSSEVKTLAKGEKIILPSEQL